MYTKEIAGQFSQIFAQISQTQAANIEAAAQIVAESIRNQGYFFLYDRGHLMGSELIARSGGAAFVRTIDFHLPNVVAQGMAGSTEKMRSRISKEEMQKVTTDFEHSFYRYNFYQNGLTKGDTLLINSVSGKNKLVNSVAETAKELGLHLIAITSLNTQQHIRTPECPMFSDYADVVIDNCVRYGDAVLELEGLDEKIVSASGMAASYIGWNIVYRCSQLLLENHIMPTIYRSVNIDGGQEQNRLAIERFNSLGF
ncbi:MAG: sugar isomerase domain-containing protein [Candidatus Merdivicinus sp.]|jgi:uncharacterized phosphosugar-binding protein